MGVLAVQLWDCSMQEKGRGERLSNQHYQSHLRGSVNSKVADRLYVVNIDHCGTPHPYNVG
jgi:hypothetical protein